MQFDTKLTSEDMSLLVESVDEWECTGNGEFFTMNMVKNLIMPPEDNPAYEMIQNLKEHFSKREKEIKASRAMRQERATLLKAKLMLNRNMEAVDKLFEQAKTPVVEEMDPTFSTVDVKQLMLEKTFLENKIKHMENYIKEVGIDKHYAKHCEENPVA